MAIDLARIARFLNQPGVEGPRQVRGYVPARPGNFTGGVNQRPEAYAAIGASGVTIATGCDLGQTDEATLRRYGLPTQIVGQLAPYLGLRREAAIARLHERPLLVTEAVAEAIDTAVHGGYLSQVVRTYDACLPCTSFERLPAQAQTVVFSLCFQLGCTGARKRAPNTWGALVRGEWGDAANRLQNAALWEGYQHRRAMEGRHLEEVV